MRRIVAGVFSPLTVTVLTVGCLATMGCASQSTSSGRTTALAWRMKSPDPSSPAATTQSVRTGMLTLGAGDRIGVRLEEARIARAVRPETGATAERASQVAGTNDE
jgi:hypothetical protein